MRQRPARPDLLDNNNFIKGPFRLSNQTTPQEGAAADALSMLQRRATAEGPSQSAQYLMQKNQGAMDRAQGSQLRQNASQFQQLQDSLAMRGGMDRGARLRGAQDLQRQNMQTMAQGNIQRANNDLGILAQDEQSKFNLLQDMPGQNLRYADFQLGKDKFDIENSLGTANNFYNQDMSSWAALNSAKDARKAARNTGGLFGSGGFLGTGLHL